MDPISAIGLTASIITFISFSHDLVKGVNSIRSATGLTRENEHLGTVVEDLKKAAKGFHADLKGNTEHGEQLSKLAANCLGLSKELGEILDKLRVDDSNSTWQKLKVSFAGKMKEKKIASIEKRLGEYRQEIIFRLNLIMCTQQSSIKKQLDNIEKEAQELSLDSAKRMSDLRIHLEQTVLQLQDNGSSIESYVQNGEQGDQQSLADLRRALSTLSTLIGSMPREIYILRRLWFGSIHTREDSVERPEDDTFRWMVQGPEDELSPPSAQSRHSTPEPGNSSSKPNIATQEGEQVVQEPDKINSSSTEELAAAKNDSVALGENADKHTGSDLMLDEMLVYDLREERERQCASNLFLSFLRQDNGVFFICGKAGSGKSTIMKFLANNCRVRQELDCWAGNRKLVFIRVFFWNSGDTLQMSREGFYRSVLFETLTQCPDLARHIYPDNLEQPPSWPPPETPFRTSEIMSAFKKLRRTSQFSSHCFCFFIDGLDEFEGDGLSHTELAECLQSWGQSVNVKVICAGRPHSEFLDTFNHPGRTIHLHELTRRDIHLYSQSMFMSALKKAKSNVTGQDILNLVEDLVDMADGVFLWARLVVRSLVEAIAHKATVKELNKMLRGFPKDLNSVFSKMLKGVNSLAQEQSDNIILMATHNPFGPLNAMVYSWIDRAEDDERFPFDEPFEGYSEDEIHKRHEDVRHQLDYLTKGLLEMKLGLGRHPTTGHNPYFRYQVEFFHRSVKDYLKDEWSRREISRSKRWIVKPETYCRLLLAEAKFAPVDHFNTKYYLPLGGICSNIVSLQQRLGYSRLVSYIDEFSKIVFSSRCLLNRVGYPAFSEPATSGLKLPAYWPRDAIGKQTWIQKSDVLLAASLVPDPDLVLDLFRIGASPNHLIQVNYWTEEPKSRASLEIPVWIAFLRLLALEIWKAWTHDSPFYHFDRLCRFVPIVEQFLKFGADPDVVFLACREHLLDYSWSLVYDSVYETSHIHLNCPRADDEVAYIELERVLQSLQPENTFGTFQISRREDANRPWGKYKRAEEFQLCRHAPAGGWFGGYCSECKETDGGKFFIFGVASRNLEFCRLFDPFRVYSDSGVAEITN